MSALMLLAACSGGKSEPELLQSAKQLIQERQLPGATIELKNLLQKNPSSAEARYLLGQVLLESGDLKGAETELLKARELAHPDVLVIPALARVMLLRGQHRKIISDFAGLKLNDARASAELDTTLARAYGVTGQADKVSQLLDSALKTRPDYLPALLLKVRQIASAGDVDAALKRLRDPMVSNAKNPEAAHLEGSLKLNGKQDIAGALEAYQRALSYAPTYVPAHTSLVALHLYKKDLAAARQQVTALKKAQPEAWTTVLYEAQMDFLEGKHKEARDLTQRLLKVAPEHLRALYIAGASEYELNNLVQANAHLSKALSLDPGLTPARQMLAKSHLRAAQPSQALKVLAPALEEGKADALSLGVAGEAYLQSGDLAKAEAFYQRALKLKPDDTRLRTSLALTVLGRGQDEAGLKDLETVARSDAGVVADMALISARMRRGELDAALEAIANVEKKQADKPLPYFLRGRALNMRGDTAGARQSFEQALRKDALYFPAVNGLVLLDLVEGKAELGRKRLEDFLKADPGNARAMLSLADLRAVGGADKDEVLRLIGNAVKAGPAELLPRSMQIDFLLSKGDHKGALSAAQAAVVALPDSPDLQDALGRAQLASGDTQQALATFGKLAQAYPKLPRPHSMMGGIHARAGNLPAALRSFREALTLAPGKLDLQREIVKLELQSKDSQKAMDMALAVQRQRPTEAVGHVLQGDVEMSRLRWEAAVAAYKSGLGKKEPGDSPARLHFALLQQKKDAEAEHFAGEWLRDHAQDIAFHRYLGDLALLKQQWAEAQQHYRAIIKTAPNDLVAANNVAWTMAQLKQAGAVAMAEKVVAKAPKSANALDTLAAAQAAENQLAKAVESSTKAVALAPESPGLRLHLAKLQLQAGNKDKAKLELERLAALGSQFKNQAEVGALLKGL